MIFEFLHLRNLSFYWVFLRSICFIYFWVSFESHNHPCVIRFWWWYLERDLIFRMELFLMNLKRMLVVKDIRAFLASQNLRFETIFFVLFQRELHWFSAIIMMIRLLANVAEIQTETRTAFTIFIYQLFIRRMDFLTLQNVAASVYQVVWAKFWVSKLLEGALF